MCVCVVCVEGGGELLVGDRAESVRGDNMRLFEKFTQECLNSLRKRQISAGSSCVAVTFIVCYEA